MRARSEAMSGTYRTGREAEARHSRRTCSVGLFLEKTEAL